MITIPAFLCGLLFGWLWRENTRKWFDLEAETGSWDRLSDEALYPFLADQRVNSGTVSITQQHDTHIRSW